VQIGVLSNGQLRFPANLSSHLVGPPATGPGQALRTMRPADDGAGGLVLPLLVKGCPSGVLHVRRRWGQFDERDRAVLESLAAQLSIALENARLYRQIDGLFRQYMSPDVATALLADPEQAALGGALVEVTALFADLRGFTTFSERASPHEIVELLNRYFAAATRVVLAEGGTIVQFVGDAMMALFNAPVRQRDHPARAARAALALQRAVEELTADQPDAPRFRVGVNTGAALVGNIGSEQLRNFNAMGDAVNVAARLQALAEPGTVVIGEATRRALGDHAQLSALGALTLRGRQNPVEAFVLHALNGDTHGPR
jgi:class 3 adenylate cyclase